MADDNKKTLSPVDKVNKEWDQFDELSARELGAIDALKTPEEQAIAYERYDNLQRTGKAALKQRLALAEAGQPIDFPEEDQAAPEGGLNYILNSLAKPSSALAQGTEAGVALYQGDTEAAKELGLSALKNATPFYETISGDRPEKSGFTKVFERAGVPEGGALSDVLPGLFSETGEGMALQEGGLFDPTARGALGFATDVVTDPLNFVPVGAAVKGAGRLIDDGVKAATGNSVRELAANNALISSTARGFNKFAFLSKDPDKQEATEAALREALTKLDNTDPAIAQTLFARFGSEESLAKELNAIPESVKLKNPSIVADITKQFEQRKAAASSIQDPAVFKALNTLSDVSFNIKSTEGLTQILADYPTLRDNVSYLGALSPEDLKAAFIKDSGLNASQIASFNLVESILKDVSDIKVKQLGVLEKDLARNWMPRKFVDLGQLDDVMPDALAAAKADPVKKDMIELVFYSNDQAKALGMEGVDVNKVVHAENINSPYNVHARVFRNFAESKAYAELLGGKMEDDLSKVLFSEISSVEKAVVEKRLMANLTKIHGSELPRNVRETVQNMFGPDRSPESMKALSTVWNKHFIQPLKKALTVPFPQFHVRNIIDDTVKGWQGFGLKALDPIASKDAAHIVGGSNALIDLGTGVQLTAADLERKMINLGVIKHKLLQSDIDKSFDNLSKQLNNQPGHIKASLKKTLEWLPVNEQFGLKFNNHARVKGALVEAKKYLKQNGAASLDEALLAGAKASKKVFFDIADLGPVDDLLAQVIPFYRFTRKNIPFQIENLAMNPQRASKLALANENFQVQDLSEEERNSLSPYMKDALTISLGNDINGNATILSGLGLSIEDFNNYISTQGGTDTLRKILVGQAAPPIQALYGLISNQHPFFGDELDSYRNKKTYKSFYENKYMNKLVGGIQKTPTNKKNEDGEVEYRYELLDPKQYFKVMAIMSPIATAATALIPGAGAAGTLLGGVVSPRGIQKIGNLTSREPGADLEALLLNNFTGMKINTVDLNAQRMRQLTDLYKKEYQGLKDEGRRLKAYYKLGMELSDDEIPELEALPEDE